MVSADATECQRLLLQATVYHFGKLITLLSLFDQAVPVLGKLINFMNIVKGLRGGFAQNFLNRWQHIFIVKAVLPFQRWQYHLSAQPITQALSFALSHEGIMAVAGKTELCKILRVVFELVLEPHRWTVFRATGPWVFVFNR